MPASRAARNSIDQHRIIEAAISLLDRDGLQALTMRKLAEFLSVSPMAIYHHVTTKEDLLSLVTEELFAKIALPNAEGHWRQELERRSHSMREVLTKHSWAIPLMETQRNPGPRNLQHHESVLEILRSSDFSIKAASQAYAILDAFTYGFAFQETLLSSIGLEEQPEEVAEKIDFTSSPRIAEMAQFYIESPEYPFTASFDIGLAVTLDGLAKLRESA